MLATVSSSARALLEDGARRYLDEEEMVALSHRLREVGTFCQWEFISVCIYS